MPDAWSIRTQLVASLLAVLLPLAALGVYSVHADYRVSSERAENSVLSLADLTAANLGQFLKDAETTLLDLASREAVQALDPEGCGALLRPAGTFLPQYTNLFVTDLEARLVCSALPLPDVLPPPPRDEAWFRGVLEGEGFYRSGPLVGRLSGRWASILGHPVRDSSGAMVGVVAVSLDLIRVQNLLQSPALPEGAVITIDDLDGTVVARSLDAEEWIGRQLPSAGVPDGALLEARGVTHALGAEGIERVWGYAQVPDSDWRVWAGLPNEWVYAPVREGAVRRILLGVFVLVVAGLLAYLLHRRIGSALARLVQGAQEAAGGTAESIPVAGPAEVAQVAMQFNRTLRARGRAIEAHQRAEERYRSIMENAAFGIYLSTPQGAFLEVNPALAEMLGYDSCEELRAVPLPTLYRDPARREELMAQHAGRTRIERVEVDWLRKDGAPVTVRLNGNVIRHSSGEIAYEVIAEDVTERRKLEEQLRHTQKMEAVGRIAGGVAHDFNNLLMVITAETELLLDELGEANPLRRGVEQVRHSADRATALTRQLLAFSRKSVLQTRVLDVNRGILETERMLRRLVGEVTLELRLAPDIRPVRADAGQLQQVLMNLCLNARDALGGKGRIEIGTNNVALGPSHPVTRLGIRQGEYVAISVRDDGSGIPVELQQRVFEPFFTTKPEGEGTGLGLATVYGIATQAGGHVDLQSEPGRGSVFTVYLPVAPEVEAGAAAEGAGAEGAGADAADPADPTACEREPAAARPRPEAVVGVPRERPAGTTAAESADSRAPGAPPSPADDPPARSEADRGELRVAEGSADRGGAQTGDGTGLPAGAVRGGADQPGGGAGRAGGGAGQPGGGSETILVAEDEAAVRSVVARILRRRGYRILEARDGVEALAVAREYEGPIHLLLTDVVMPRMQGPEAAARILSVRPRIRIVLMSGHTENPEVLRPEPGRRYPFLPKPFMTDALLVTIREALEGGVEDLVRG